MSSNLLFSLLQTSPPNVLPVYFSLLSLFDEQRLLVLMFPTLSFYYFIINTFGDLFKKCFLK